MSNNSASTIQLTMYGRRGCHLCDDMQENLASYEDEMDFSVNIVDIDDDPVLIGQFGTKVPVLMHRKTEICHYFLDLKALQMYFSQSPE